MDAPPQLPLVIFGAGGHGRVVLDAAQALGMTVAGFLGPSGEAGGIINGLPVLGGEEMLHNEPFLSHHQFVVAIGQQRARRHLALALVERGALLATVIHPRAIVSPSVAVGSGSVVVAGAVINANARIGRFCLINTSATIDHDAHLHDGVQVCPGANLAGGVICEGDAFIGTGAVIIPGVRIGAEAVVGAGAVVIRDVPPRATVVGNPARVLHAGEGEGPRTANSP